MKTVVILLIISLFTGSNLIARPFFSPVPDEIETSMAIKYKDANVKRWRKVNKTYRVIFEINRVRYRAFFDESGEWLYTKANIKKDRMPREVALGFYKSKYKFWRLNWITEMHFPENHYYILEIDNKNDFSDPEKQLIYSEEYKLYFSPRGEFIKIEKKWY